MAADSSLQKAPDSGEVTPLDRFKQMRGFGDLLQIPLIRQFALMASMALAIAVGLTLFFWAQKPAYVPIYDGMTEKDSSAVADALRTANIPFQLDSLTGAVTVPSDKVHEARLRAAAAGLPKGSGMGFEMLQQDPGLGTSQFVEGARYQLALETELGRTIASLQSIKNARVHLALPKPSAFTQNRVPASASVLVELQPGRMLESGQVDAIQHIVASSVPNLTPSGVSVVDQLGRLLSNTDSNSEIAQSGEQYQYERRLESDYVRRVEELLAPMLGVGHVSVQVAADLDFSETEEAHETYLPEHSVVRSEQTNEETNRGNQPLGVPGALSNQPPVAAPKPTPPAQAAPVAGANGQIPQSTTAGASAASATQTVQQSKSQTRNFELDRTVSHTRHPVGRVRRLSVAVLVDYIARPGAAIPVATTAAGAPNPAAPPAAVLPVALSADEIAKVEALVKQAVGFDQARGDSVTVQSAPFLASEIAPIPPLPMWKRPGFEDYLRQGLGALLVLVLILSVLRPLAKSLIGGTVTPEEAAAMAAEERGQLNGPKALGQDGSADGGQGNGAQGQLESGEQIPAVALPPPISEQRLALARAAVAEDPKRVSQVVKTWLGEDG